MPTRQELGVPMPDPGCPPARAGSRDVAREKLGLRARRWACSRSTVRTLLAMCAWVRYGLLRLKKGIRQALRYRGLGFLRRRSSCAMFFMISISLFDGQCSRAMTSLEWISRICVKGICNSFYVQGERP